jgi:hypothetical protein
MSRWPTAATAEAGFVPWPNGLKHCIFTWVAERPGGLEPPMRGANAPTMAAGPQSPEVDGRAPRRQRLHECRGAVPFPVSCDVTVGSDLVRKCTTQQRIVHRGVCSPALGRRAKPTSRSAVS